MYTSFSDVCAVFHTHSEFSLISTQSVNNRWLWVSAFRYILLFSFADRHPLADSITEIRCRYEIQNTQHTSKHCSMFDFVWLLFRHPTSTFTIPSLRLSISFLSFWPKRFMAYNKIDRIVGEECPHSHCARELCQKREWKRKTHTQLDLQSPKVNETCFRKHAEKNGLSFDSYSFCLF